MEVVGTVRKATKCSSVCRALAVLCLLASAVGAQTLLTYDPYAGEFPVGIAVDKVGNVWVSLQYICQVRRYTPDWQESLRLNLLSTAECVGWGGAGGLAVDATGAAYVAVSTASPDTRGVYKIEPWGHIRRLPGTGQMTYANSLAFDHNNGTLYVTDFDLGAVWRIPDGRPAELWIQSPVLEGIALWPGGPRLGANGIAVHQGYVIVSVSSPTRLVRIPIGQHGSAGAPEILVSTAALVSAGVFALDDIALDVFGNVYAGAVMPSAVVRMSADGSQIAIVAGPVQGVTASALSLAFGTGKGERQSVFVAMCQGFYGTGCGVVRIDAGVPGRPLP